MHLNITPSTVSTDRNEEESFELVFLEKKHLANAIILGLSYYDEFCCHITIVIHIACFRLKVNN